MTTTKHVSHLHKMSCRMTKPTKWPTRPAKSQISRGFHPVWSIFAVRMKKAWVLSYTAHSPLSAQRSLWSDWADACRLISVSAWRTCHFDSFIVRRLKYSLHAFSDYIHYQSFWSPSQSRSSLSAFIFLDSRTSKYSCCFCFFFYCCCCFVFSLFFFVFFFRNNIPFFEIIYHS